MSGRIHGSVWVVALVLVIGGSGGCATDLRGPEAVQPYEMTLQVLVSGRARNLGLPCKDFFSRPDYYATATRRDRKVEAELDRVRRELREVAPEIQAISDRIAPLERRGGVTVPLSEHQLEELKGLREKRRELRRSLRKRISKERELLDRDRAELEAAVWRLENSIPLSEKETLVLRGQSERRDQLSARMSFLKMREDALNNQIRMATPGSLRVYPNDSVRVRLMDDDVGISITPAVFNRSGDDFCASWRLRLDRQTLDNGGVELKKGDHPLVRLSVRPVSP